MSVRVWVYDPAELSEVVALLEGLDVEYVASADAAPEVALVSASQADCLADLKECTRVLFHGGDASPEALAHCEYRVRRPVHPEALRLLLLHLLYRGEERRSENRTPVGLEMALETPAGRARATLVDLSWGGARLHVADRFDPGGALTLHLEGVSDSGPLSLPARVQRVDFDPRLTELGLRSLAIRFDEMPTSLRRELDWLLLELGETPPSIDPGTDGDDAQRRRNPRRAFRRKVPTFEAAGLRVLIGRDLSMDGMRVEQADGLAAGDRLELAIYGSEREEPTLIDAVIDRDDGPSGFMLRFTDLTEAQRAQIEQLLERLPAIEATAGGGSQPTHPSHAFLRS